MKLKPYPKYKDSGVEWLGEVPEGWEVKALKWESPVFRGASPRPIDDPIYFDDEGEYAWVRIADVTAAGKYLEKTTQRLSNIGCSLSVKLSPKELFLSIAGSVGKPCIANIKCCIHDGFVYFPKWKGVTTFLYYIFASGESYRGLGKLGTQLNLNTDTVGSIYVSIPPLPEQHAIADFLDTRTAKLDALMDKKRELIGKLREKREALISQAVTKGIVNEAFGTKNKHLSEDGKPVFTTHLSKLVPSNIDWLGDVPEEWGTKRLSYLALLKSGDGITSQDFEDDGEYPVFGGNGLRGYYSGYTHEGNFVLIGRQGALCGNINYATGKFWASEHAVVVIPLARFSTRWMGELLRTMNLNQYSVSAAQPGLSADVISALRIPVPPFPEQTAIAAYLDTETAKIDRLIAKVESALDKLSEYRSALITAAVTGKIDVRNFSAMDSTPEQKSTKIPA